jgi:hypothetical protein
MDDNCLAEFALLIGWHKKTALYRNIVRLYKNVSRLLLPL